MVHGFLWKNKYITSKPERSVEYKIYHGQIDNKTSYNKHFLHKNWIILYANKRTCLPIFLYEILTIEICLLTYVSPVNTIPITIIWGEIKPILITITITISNSYSNNNSLFYYY